MRGGVVEEEEEDEGVLFRLSQEDCAILVALVNSPEDECYVR